METTFTIILSVLGFYIMIGFLFAVAFVIKGIKVVDLATASTSKSFKLMMFPGSVGLWPVLLRKWIKAK